MTAIIQIGDVRAVMKDGKWTSANKTIQDLLNTMLPAGGPSGADPNPDGTAAEEAVKRLGGRVISIDETESEPGVVY